jgi:hypothetical protein
MSKQASEIEVEVVELENKLPASPRGGTDTQTCGPEQRAWRQWQGRLRRIDARWWPLWAIPGLALLVLLAAVGLLIGVLFVIFLGVRNLLRSITR